MQNGWNVTIETTGGVVGLWSCWMDNCFRIFYPLEVSVSDEIIMETLGVQMAEPVANDLFGSRLWARYYSNRLPDLGRVWIEHEKNHSNGHTLYTIKDKKLEGHYVGHSESHTLGTFQFHFASETEPDAPNCRSENIQPYKDKFIQLLVKIAKLTGEIEAVNVESGGVLFTPEQLMAKRLPLTKSGDLYTKYYYTEDDGYEIMLKSGNSIVPWITVIRFQASNVLVADEIKDFLDGFDNSECAFNVVPLIADMLKKEMLYRDFC